MELEAYFRFLFVLIFVIALITFLAFLLKRYGMGGRISMPGGQRRLHVVEMSPIDGKRRLVLIRRDHTEHLLLLGPTNELVIETDIARRTDDTADDVIAALPGGQG